MKRIQYHIFAGSFVLATLVWLAVTLSETYTTQVSVPLTVSKLPSDVVLAKPLPPEIEITVRGTGWQLLLLIAGKQSSFDIPAARLHSGVLHSGVVLTNRILSEAIKLPSGVQALEVYPDTLLVVLDQFITKKVPLTFSTENLTFKPGFGISGPVALSPEFIILRGAERVLKNISSWPLEAKAFHNLTSPVSDVARVMDSLPGLVKLDLEKVKLFVPVQQLADITVDNIAIQVNNVPAGKHVMLEKNSVQIFVRGGVNVLAALTPADYQASVDYATLLLDTTGVMTPQLHLPPGVTLLRIAPPEIHFIIRE
jgi:hypothetical protein